MEELDYLTKIACEFADLIGLENTKKLMVSFGGRSFDVPRNAGRARILNAILPPDAVEKLCHMYGGCRFSHFPTISKFNNSLRNAEIIGLYGVLTVKEISLRYGLCTRHIYKILNLAPNTLDSPKPIPKPHNSSSSVSSAFRSWVLPTR